MGIILWQSAKKALEPRQILSKIRRQLPQERADSVSQRIDAPKKLVKRV
jgi:hypothetical protein